FPHVLVDSDGVRRRIDLVVSYGGEYFGQLVFAPLISYLGNPTVELSARRIVLKGATIPGHPPRDLTIPLTPQGEFLLNWPKRTFAGSFRQLPYYSLVRYTEQEDVLVELLRGMADANYFSFVPDGATFLEPYDKAASVKQQVLSGGSPDLIPSYRELRAGFFEAVGRFLDGDTEQRILAQIDAALANRGVSSDQKDQMRSIRADVVSKFDDTRKIYAAFMESRKDLAQALAGAFCIIGATATSTTDFGVNPFDRQYANVGTHATVANSILSGRYIEEVPLWYSTALGAILGLGLFLVIRRRTPLQSILIGVGFILASLGGTVALFVLTRIYLAVTALLLTLVLVFTTLTIVRYLSEAREKSFIRNAFGRYLSGDVVNELLANPAMLTLGGQQKELTAMFTDVKGFSTFSEQLSPSDLVSLLNKYLTAMSDLIMEERGTIDKYEGDAIISFFGAPVSFADHAARACAAALRMKATEALLNERFAAEGSAPSALLTRIGINTGEMVVGNMGTENKMDYTIMGNSVNLASRLEGVNKQYSTWILVSEATRVAAGNQFLFRKLDRVRVVGIQQPVRLFELVAAQGSDGVKKETVERFHGVLDVFEAKDWNSARRGFEEILKDAPEDGPSRFYLKRCDEYLKTPPAANWDGVFSLTAK
ncbi:MAG TPA: adenylate/guanylate cyclase domain-containing protein, partial [Candidatus Sulfotelmatobacter sp.]|nr:adenylate/guanylate cyclase domain-containing protein [Candidatus Sulfotelmatobacter sp.]